jgi:hypothetical protein
MELIAASRESTAAEEVSYLNAPFGVVCIDAAEENTDLEVLPSILCQTRANVSCPRGYSAS